MWWAHHQFAPPRAQESPVSLIGKLHVVRRTEVWVGEVTIIVPTKFCRMCRLWKWWRIWPFIVSVSGWLGHAGLLRFAPDGAVWCALRQTGRSDCYLGYLTPSKKMQDLTPIRLNPVCLLPCKQTYNECVTELASIEWGTELRDSTSNEEYYTVSTPSWCATISVMYECMWCFMVLDCQKCGCSWNEQTVTVCQVCCMEVVCKGMIIPSLL